MINIRLILSSTTFSVIYLWSDSPDILTGKQSCRRQAAAGKKPIDMVFKFVDKNNLKK
jgi:hypothetical protein